MSKKILIVDDEIYIRVLLEQTLEDFEDAGVELLTVGDGLEAWEVARTERPDLIILDVMMPGLSGYEVCQRIKSDPNLSDIHVIMLTAKGQEIDRLRSIEVGADEYITKPFDPDYLIERTADVLGVSIP
ncbi:MAG: response regulator [Chloroflexi bacterium]|nr:MAG: response regulator [Chloroflexota bacterium]